MLLRAVTEADRDDACALVRSWEGLDVSPINAVIQNSFLGLFGYGILAIGAVHFVLGWFFDISLAVKAPVIIGAALLGGLIAGVDGWMWATENQKVLADLRKRVAVAIELGQVWVYSSAHARSHFDYDANPEHPPMVIEFEDGERISLEAMEQDQFEIGEEICGECEVVTLCENGQVLSVTTPSGVTHLRQAVERMAKYLR